MTIPHPTNRVRKSCSSILAATLTLLISQHALAQFQKPVPDSNAQKQHGPVYCPTVDLNGEQVIIQQHVDRSPAELVSPPVVPSSEPPELSETDSAALRTNQSRQHELQQLRAHRKARLDEILNQLRSWKQNSTRADPPERDHLNPPSPPTPELPEQSKEADDNVPFPDQPRGSEHATTPTVSPEGPEFEAQDSSPIKVMPEANSGGNGERVTKPTDSETQGTSEEQKPDQSSAPEETPEGRQSFAEMIDALTRDDVKAPADPPESGSTEPGYLSATTVLNSPVDRIKLADSLFATGEIQLSLTMYEAINVNKIPPSDRSWVGYQMACCNRRIGNIGEAESAFRQIAGDNNAGQLAEVSRWWLDRISDRKELKRELNEISTLLKTYQEARANADSGTK